MADTLFPMPQPFPERRGHAANPGSGPKGETCKTCAHCVRTQSPGGSTFFKCGLMRDHWTHGGGTDIRANDPACKEWKERSE